ncbi:MAG: signal recognition particle-docking protein FtsY, partial [Candidatus Cloacimonetes bacterium]|nr:signal recognition particle-docking protein FtsY [Candidatus Cloacimonadota bacterium]
NDKINDPQQIKEVLKNIILELMHRDYDQKVVRTEQTGKPLVIIFTGVNGVGKTTTIGKLAHRYVSAGKSVLLIAADTFRAAAAEQLGIWADRAGALLHRQQSGADPSSVVYDGLSLALKKGIDVVLIDTAGRQHTSKNLMKELGKIARTITKLIPDAPHDVLQVLDATTGQNAIAQVKIFDNEINLTGLVLTKLDGTAKGGIVIGIKHQIGLPVKYIGVGEKLEDLQDFQVDEFVSAILN